MHFLGDSLIDEFDSLIEYEMSRLNFEMRDEQT